ncbi:DUF2798 domain-containing protein [Methanimicrococcus blatticola]|uniref:Uncharacterized protein DUF2798 n=1 Tax=Methanimicrococcus blatticola TaxID=91560 RepID=A0A484F5K5_9EURY|nr:DUF2798 domain-containing protein [Methanimicrococcus blatticola]MBZ3935360.1 DUF2798 domain-containing protein [Methanimicrococcus blatticola]MCC2508542.1 DUF2798 domain-containing protein [Methanimicrococcus blatticola]TDQ67848.1 uncharacterized protein DUF2798 [Methanimicrococcus blatticola]
MVKRKLITAFCMTFFMSCGMSLIMLLMNAGLPDPFLTTWFKAWAIAFVFAFLLTNIISPIVLTKIVPFIMGDNRQAAAENMTAVPAES